MSKSTPAKPNQAVTKPPQSLAHLPPRAAQMPAVQEPSRDVTGSLALLEQKENNVIATYKDLNQPHLDQISFQKKQFAFAVALIILATTCLLAYRQITKPRAIASTFTGFVSEGTPVSTEHYQYDKSCYTGENGEHICMTRTSQKR